MPVVATPLMFTINAPALAEVQERFEAPVPLAVRETGVTLNGLQVRPAGGVAVRATEPTKFCRLVNVTADEIDAPVAPLGLVAPIEKSPT